MDQRMRVLSAFVVALAVLTGAACSKKIVKTDSAVAAAAVEDAVAGDPNAPFDPKTVVGTEWRLVPQLRPALFGLDQSTLSAEARQVLQANAKLLKSFPEVEVRVTGHCDERGTVEYNIALGERRAGSAKRYYRDLGLSERRLSTISFGEERPLCQDETEDCWSRNRRVETRVRVLPDSKAKK